MGQRRMRELQWLQEYVQLPHFADEFGFSMRGHRVKTADIVTFTTTLIAGASFIIFDVIGSSE